MRSVLGSTRRDLNGVGPGREQLVHNGITAGPYFQNALASYVEHMTTIASSAASVDLEHRATSGPTADLELEGQDVRRGVKR